MMQHVVPRWQPVPLAERRRSLLQLHPGAVRRSSVQLLAYQWPVHPQIGIGLLVDRLVVTRQPLPRHLRKPPAFVKLRIVHEDMPAAEHIAKLIDVEPVRLQVGENRSLFRRESLGCLHQPAAVATVAGGQLDEQADPGARLLGLVPRLPQRRRAAAPTDVPRTWSGYCSASG